jgi:FO synthase
MAGSTNGSRRERAELEAIAASVGRPARQRTSLYGHVTTEDRTIEVAS